MTQWTEFEQTLGDSEGQECLLCCSLWGCKESDMTEQLNWKANVVEVQGEGLENDGR